MFEIVKKRSSVILLIASAFAAVLLALTMLGDPGYAYAELASSANHEQSDSGSIDAASEEGEESALDQDAAECTPIAMDLSQKAGSLSATSAANSPGSYQEYQASFDANLTGTAFGFGVCLLIAAIIL